MTTNPAAHTESTFAVELSASWTEHGVIPPRCRNPRDVEHSVTATAHVAMVTAEQAPVVFRVTDRITSLEEKKVTEYRSFGGRLFTLGNYWDPETRTYGPAIAGFDRFRPVQRYGRHLGYGIASEEEAIAVLVGAFESGHLIIDGTVWVATDNEPAYQVVTFGLGGNHGGTGLMVTTAKRNAVSPDYFGADQFEAARAHAITVAANRGDTHDVDRHATATPSIEVLDASAITVAYTDPTYAYDVEFTSTPAERYSSRKLRIVRSMLQLLEVEDVREYGHCPMSARDHEKDAALNGYTVTTTEEIAARLSDALSSALDGRPVRVARNYGR